MPNCCEHCRSVVQIDGRLDKIELLLAKMETDFVIVRRIVYGGVALVLTAAGGAAIKAIGLS